ncbi:hypothetical protein BE25_0028 [Staphylococcus phage vB_SepM_BE25]|nr:hypothetical protein BE25_0028 [Staphylococcus phage vB_SepM_BE25]
MLISHLVCYKLLIFLPCCYSSLIVYFFLH